MDEVTPDQCKAVVTETGATWLGHHKCFCCGEMVGYEFRRGLNAHPSWQQELGLSGPDDVVPFFVPACGCSSRGIDGEPRSWSEFARDFNMQKPEIRAVMWERFKAGKATHEVD